MKRLSPYAQELAKLGKQQYQPTDADKARIREALGCQLTTSPSEHQAPGSKAASKVAATSQISWPVIGAVTVTVGVVAGALFGVFTQSSTPRDMEVTVVPVSPTASAIASGEPLSPTPTAKEQSNVAPGPEDKPEVREVEQVRPTQAAIKKKPHLNNHLGEEVALLSRATSALHEGRPRAALAALAEHQRKFPRGSLSLERRAARAQALCMLGRVAEAERELKGFSSSSPQAARARQFCQGK